MLTIHDGASAICNLLKSGKPFFVGRNGTIELQVLDYWNRFRIDKKSYPTEMKVVLERNAGIFPATETSFDAWSKLYVEAIANLDLTAAGWYGPLKDTEDKMLTICAPNVLRCPLRSLEPYYVPKSLQWTQCLAGKKVAVVSSFTKTIQAQLKKAVWTVPLFPENVEFSFVQTGYSPSLALGKAGWPDDINSWEDAVNYVVNNVVNSGAELALIGCGGLGMVIGGRLKAKGISAIILGGAIQVLFGIKGTRWANHDVIASFWNDQWAWPSTEEVPGGSVLVEGGCYW